uniref:Uncharacterized protein n=1 Tax=Romanomermis culicivorax TaxID=13658 RepID=A0A915I229_ROMCU
MSCFLRIDNDGIHILAQNFRDGQLIAFMRRLTKINESAILTLLIGDLIRFKNDSAVSILKEKRDQLYIVSPEATNKHAGLGDFTRLLPHNKHLCPPCINKLYRSIYNSPDPFGPMTALNVLNGPILCFPLYDLKFSSSISNKTPILD